MTNTFDPNRAAYSARGQKPAVKSLPMEKQIDLLEQAIHEGIPLSASEILGDLMKLLTYLKTNLAQQREGTSSFLSSRSQALVYSERVATYALQDYPRHVEGEPRITRLWDALYSIRQTVSTWRMNDYASDGQTELATIEKSVQDALQRSGEY
jgi:hypothetical protein